MELLLLLSHPAVNTEEAMTHKAIKPPPLILRRITGSSVRP
jgi:hypothetical protein